MCLEWGMGVQGGEQGLDPGKLLGGAEPLKEEEDMWFRQQLRSAALLVCLPPPRLLKPLLTRFVHCHAVVVQQQHSMWSCTASV